MSTINTTADRTPFVPEVGELVFARCHKPNAELIRGLPRDHPNPAHSHRPGLAVSKANEIDCFTSGWYQVIAVDGRQVTVREVWNFVPIVLWILGVR